MMCNPRTPGSGRVLTVALALLLGLTTIACERRDSLVADSQTVSIDTTPRTTRTSAGADSSLGFPDLPDPAKTPGDPLPVTAADICVRGYSRRVRNVPSGVKRRVYARYGVRSHEAGEYEVDHLISLGLGGSNSVRNLWPQTFRRQPWNAYVKDDLENELHRRVCAGRITLAAAQQAIASNWIVAYRKYVRPTPSSPKAKRTRSTPSRAVVP